MRSWPPRLGRDELLERIVAWVQAEPRVRALVQTGSGARDDGSFDEFSDLDLEVVAEDPSWLVADSGWYRQIAPVMVALELENDPGEWPTRLVFYLRGHKVDYTLCDRRRLQAVASGGRIVDPLYERGYRVLVDKDGLAGRLPAAGGTPPKLAPPTQAELDAVVTEFWFEAAHIPRYLLRGELWVAKQRDWTMKQDLLRLLEWRAALAGRDVWHIGTHLRDWVDEKTWRELHGVFGHFDAGDSWRALFITCSVFARAAHEVAELAGLRHDGQVARAVGRYVLSFGERLPPGAAPRRPDSMDS